MRGLIPAAAAFGPLTLLVNNASQFDEDEIGHLDRARLERTLAVNLTAPVLLAQDFAAQAPEGADASIVNIVDQRVLKPTPRFFSYTLSKSALRDATMTLAQALAPQVRVNAVAPGPTLPSPRQSRSSSPAGGVCRSTRADAGGYRGGGGLSRRAPKASAALSIAVDGGQHLSWRTPDSDIAE